ncbi:restriction endonuclease subunit S [Streptococcus thermophilus]|nr:restriction endonuclease subunit S [Streptococcus thermophilus]MCE2225840.1 restriction endonuclease subunit S [Streptococcus thermophilus]MCE2228919.1 restriction endonuclease subunit S [Streptococcus thermophilus]MCE2233519.1 restriction endonuclease subunit S [Streptococcus thermophilus]MCE2236708.1 restriction endonuclease subunit S [Streptococcus thermophilus]
MKEKYCKIPKFRFNKFLESWKRLKYEDVIEVNSGKDYKHLEKGDIPVYGTGGYMLSVSEAITNKDGVGIGRKGTINKPYILKAPYWTVDTLFFCIPKNKYNLYFINAIFERTQWERFDESTGVPSLSKLTINNIQNYFPSFDEQSAIGSLFRLLDDLLASYKDNLANYQSLKATMLSKMFPKAGQTVPEIRLDGFEGEWKLYELKSRAETITKGTTPKDKSWQGEVNYIKTESINRDTGSLVRTASTSLDEHLGYLKRSILKEDDVLFSIVGTLGVVGIVDKKDLPANTNQQIAIIRLKRDDAIFMLNFLKSPRIKSFIKSDSTIGAQPSLSLWQIEKIKVSLPPSLEEQQAIGTYFSNLDNLIASHQEKISQLETLKKKLLQDMFI